MKYENFIKIPILDQIANTDNFLELKTYKNKAVYCGIDPTAPSIHLGHYIQLLILRRLEKLGFKIIILIGDGTALIGDPSGKNKERELKSIEQITLDAEKLKTNIKKIVPNAKYVNNYEWLKDMTYIDILRSYGKYLNVSSMVKKESIASRISIGISYSEFSYSLLQAIDFLYLYTKYNCVGQIGGSDQWGNIVTGIDLLKKIKGQNHKIFGITFKLLLRSDGKKFGKTEKGAIWLDKNLTTPYELYQFLFNQNDFECETLLHYLTLLSNDEILEIIAKHKKQMNLRFLQKSLASWVILDVYGQEELNKIIMISTALFKNELSKLSENEFLNLIKTYKVNLIKNNESLKNTLKIIKATNSNREIYEFITQKSLKMNDKILTESMLDKKLSALNLFWNKYLFIKKGKRFFYVVEII